MYIWLVIFFAVGVWLTIFGGRILFSDKYLNRMYKKGYWKEDSVWFDEKTGGRFDRYGRGGRIFLVGLILVIGSIIAFFMTA